MHVTDCLGKLVRLKSGAVGTVVSIDLHYNIFFCPKSNPEIELKYSFAEVDCIVEAAPPPTVEQDYAVHVLCRKEGVLKIRATSYSEAHSKAYEMFGLDGNKMLESLQDITTDIDIGDCEKWEDYDYT